MTSSSEDDGVIKNEVDIKEESVEEISSWATNRRHSAFSPYRPVTTLTNLQRGNIETTQNIDILPEEFAFHRKASMGELTTADFTPEINVDEIDQHSLTALMWASFYGQLPTVRLLVQNKANVHAEGINGETPLLLAASGGHHEVCRYLLSCGAKPNHVDHKENTALMYAACSDSAHCVSELLENGADITMKNWEGVSAFSVAVSRGSKKAQIVMEKFLLRILEPS